ncbi:hypothetical protein GGR50DRAFT_697496 [Xylaria sp. CBS 124048]|nr:hypothetical protein GGR50DRAFT_697496 [Xylaria sp. CBS 124048]
MSDTILSELKVSVQQASKSPPKLTIGVTNTSSAIVRIFIWDTPLDPLALQLGLLSFTLEGENKAIDIPRIFATRRFPPGEDEYVSIEPGQTEKRDVLLDKPLVPLKLLQGRKARVICKGHWKDVWTTKGDASDEGPHKVELKGAFVSEPADVEF